MKKFVTSEHQRLFDTSIKQLLKDLNTKIEVHMPPTVTRCPNCLWDDAKKTSSGSFNPKFITPIVINGVTISPKSFSKALRCPVCSGKGNIEQEVKKVIPYMTETISTTSENTDLTPIGLLESGEIVVKTLAKYYRYLEGSVFIMKDGIRYTKRVAIKDGLKKPIVCISVLRRDK